MSLSGELMWGQAGIVGIIKTGGAQGTGKNEKFFTDLQKREIKYGLRPHFFLLLWGVLGHLGVQGL